VTPLDVLLDEALTHDDLSLRVRCIVANDDVAAVGSLLSEEHCTLGLSDAGAHVGQLCDAPQATDYLGNAIFPPPSGLPPGNYTVIQASFGGDGTFVPTTITFPNPLQVSVPKLNQSIVFDRAANGLDHKTFGDPDFALFASASSGLAVSFAASGACTVAGNTVHLAGSGSCTIDADQAGDATYNAAARVTQTFAIGTPTAAPTVLSLLRAAQSRDLLPDELCAPA